MSEARITIRLTEDDSAWIKAQSEALGLDNEAAVVRMLVRQARLGNVSLSVVMQGVQQPQPEPVFTYQGKCIGSDTAMRLSAYEQVPSVGDAYDPEAIPVAPDVVEDLLASRLQEMGVDSANIVRHPAVETRQLRHTSISGPPSDYGEPPDPNTPATSLRPAPLRQGRDYR